MNINSVSQQSGLPAAQPPTSGASAPPAANSVVPNTVGGAASYEQTQQTTAGSEQPPATQETGEIKQQTAPNISPKTDDVQTKPPDIQTNKTSTAASQVDITSKDVMSHKLAELSKAVETRTALIASLPEDIQKAVKDVIRQTALTQNSLPEGLANLLKSEAMTNKQLNMLANLLDDAGKLAGDSKSLNNLAQLLDKLSANNNAEASKNILLPGSGQLIAEPALKTDNQEVLSSQSRQNSQSNIQLPPELAKLAEIMKPADLAQLWKTLQTNNPENKSGPSTEAQQKLLDLARQIAKGEVSPNEARQAVRQILAEIPGGAKLLEQNQPLNNPPKQPSNMPNQTPQSAPEASIPKQAPQLQTTPETNIPKQTPQPQTTPEANIPKQTPQPQTTPETNIPKQTLQPQTAVKDIIRQLTLTQNSLPEGLANLLKSEAMTNKQLTMLASFLNDTGKLGGDGKSLNNLAQLLEKLLANNNAETPKNILASGSGQLIAEPALKTDNQEVLSGQLRQNSQSNIQLPPELAKLAEIMKPADLAQLWKTLQTNNPENKSGPSTEAQQKLLDLAGQIAKGEVSPNEARQAVRQILAEIPGGAKLLEQNQLLNNPPKPASTMATQTPQTTPEANIPKQTLQPQTTPETNIPKQALQPQATPGTNIPKQTLQPQATLETNIPKQTLQPQTTSETNMSKQAPQSPATPGANIPKQAAQIVPETKPPELFQAGNQSSTVAVGRSPVPGTTLIGGGNFSMAFSIRLEQNLGQLANNLLTGNMSLEEAKMNLDNLLKSFRGLDMNKLSQLGLEEKQAATLLKQTVNHMPPQIGQASTKYGLPELQRTWILLQATKLEKYLELLPEELKSSSATLRSLSAVMQRAAANPVIEHHAENNMLSFNTTFYFGDGQTYPANIHIYQENSAEGSGGNRRKKQETWMRITLNTENIGSVDTFFRLYEQENLDVRVRFQDSKTAYEFGQYLPEIRRAMNESPLNLTDLSVRSTINN